MTPACTAAPVLCVAELSTVRSSGRHGRLAVRAHCSGGNGRPLPGEGVSWGWGWGEGEISHWGSAGADARNPSLGKVRVWMGVAVRVCGMCGGAGGRGGGSWGRNCGGGPVSF